MDRNLDIGVWSDTQKQPRTDCTVLSTPKQSGLPPLRALDRTYSLAIVNIYVREPALRFSFS